MACRQESDDDLMKVWNHWDQVVGKAISEHAQPAACKGKMLLVHVASSAWIHQLQFLKKEIIGKLNDALSDELIEEIKFKIGPV